jgi:NAD(P)-dependent dehydrogenase (short-subunit alcohol dehydrogenase family)
MSDQSTVGTLPAPRRAFVTGGGRGIGQDIALRFANAGIDVAVAARSRSEIEEVASLVESTGRRAVAVTLDVANPDDVRRAFAEARAQLGPFDILVNNAGIAKSALVWRTDDELWRSILDINLSGTFYCMREALPDMLERGWGRIVNVASIAGKIGAPYISAYTASKHGVIGLTRAAALDVATRGVTINAICPGYVDTPMTDFSVDTIMEKTRVDAESARNRLRAMSPQNRIFSVEEVSYIALMLVSDEARGINGQAINLDGGGVTA